LYERPVEKGSRIIERALAGQVGDDTAGVAISGIRRYAGVRSWRGAQEGGVPTLDREAGNRADRPMGGLLEIDRK